jgi:hypothetical protein
VFGFGPASGNFPSVPQFIAKANEYVCLALFPRLPASKPTAKVIPFFEWRCKRKVVLPHVHVVRILGVGYGAYVYGVDRSGENKHIVCRELDSTASH